MVRPKHSKVFKAWYDDSGVAVQARAHLLNVGIIRPREDVTAIDINAFLSRPEGAPASVGRIADADKVDIARFLNRFAGHLDFCVLCMIRCVHWCVLAPVDPHTSWLAG